jgi:hypothetical protein
LLTTSVADARAAFARAAPHRAALAKKKLGLTFFKRYEARLRMAEKAEQAPADAAAHSPALRQVLRNTLATLHADLQAVFPGDAELTAAFGVGTPLESARDLLAAARHVAHGFANAQHRMAALRAGMSESRVAAVGKLRDALSLAEPHPGSLDPRVLQLLASDTERLTLALSNLKLPETASAISRSSRAPRRS